MSDELSITRRATAKDTQATEFIWTVAEYTDSVKQRQKKTVEKEERQHLRYGWKPTRTFETESEAWEFATQRARDCVFVLEAALKTGLCRLEKCKKRMDSLGATA
jgi:hypothetical protein